ncbi:MAG: hypothetical protein L3J93_01320 [Thermoplasmata archaeon]|nr:hypothetical protein [Thermoplasmata archaeon]
MTDWIWVLRGLEGFVLVVGAAIAFASWRAYRRTRRTSLLWLSVGFVLVTMAAALAGVLFEFVTHDLLSSWITSAALNGGGFAIILYSILRPNAIRIPVHDGPASVSLPLEAEGPPERPPG